MKRFMLSLCLLASSWFAVATPMPQIPLTNAEKAVEVLTYLGTTNQQPLKYIRSDYIQHNLSAPTELNGLKQFLNSFPASPQPTGQLLRVLTDGPYVIVHSKSALGFAVFDIFRFQGGKIAEHWDNLAPISTKKTPSGHTQTDGLIQPYDFSLTYPNKLLVLHAMNKVYVAGNPSAANQFVAQKVISHELGLADGLSAFKQSLQQKIDDNNLIYQKVEAVLGEGNMVLSVSSGMMNDKPMAFYDLFRVTSNKIAEHWQITAVIPPKSQWKNQNGKFNFPFGALPYEGGSESDQFPFWGNMPITAQN
ncbi:MAG: hypothetical protein CENE_03522 [Candidatus Celerinatantimonas neptuna]|nr:MAG: hypothetical protein CENE_03522 [Candidatus Celerinatantimonas neptuna]